MTPLLSPPGRRSAAAISASADASATNHPWKAVKLAFPIGHASLAPSPEHLRRPEDFRSYCHAPARLWPPKPSTDSLDLTHNRPAHGARLFQTGALLPHFKGKWSRQAASCLPLARHSGPWRSLHFSLAPANRQSAVLV